MLGNCYSPGVSSRGMMERTPDVESPTDLLTLSSLGQPWVAGSSPFTLTMLMAIPIHSSSSSNGTTTTPLTTKGFWAPWLLRCLGESKVRSASLVRVLSDGKIIWGLWSPRSAKSSTSHDWAKQHLFFYYFLKQRKTPEGERPAFLAFVRDWISV